MLTNSVDEEWEVGGKSERKQKPVDQLRKTSRIGEKRIEMKREGERERERGQREKKRENCNFKSGV